MQHVLIMSGVGGQGIVVGSKLLGIAATAQGRYCLHFAEYGGEMRGTPCECTLTLGTEPSTSPAQVSICAAAIIMHPQCFDVAVPRIAPGGLALVNASLVHPERATLRPDVEWLFVPFTEMGEAAGHPMVATMVAVGAFCAESDLVSAEAAAAALPSIIPPYRTQMIAMDERGIAAGAAAIAGGTVERVPASVPYVFSAAQPVPRV
jgi:2-oxoglutarate ferredoxin oxidoreductase subunit gamma